MYRIKFLDLQILRRQLLCFSISFMVFEMKGFKELEKSSSSPNQGEIAVRLYWLGEVLDSTPIATYTVIFSQIGQLFRKISTEKLFCTDRQTDRRIHVKLKSSFLGVSVLVESGNVLSSTSNFWRYSNTSIRSTNMEVKKVRKNRKLVRGKSGFKILSLRQPGKFLEWFA